MGIIVEVDDGQVSVNGTLCAEVTIPDPHHPNGVFTRDELRDSIYLHRVADTLRHTLEHVAKACANVETKHADDFGRGLVDGLGARATQHPMPGVGEVPEGYQRSGKYPSGRIHNEGYEAGRRLRGLLEHLEVPA